VREHAHEHVSWSTHLRVNIVFEYGNMTVELKHRKLCNKFHTDTSTCVKIYTRTRPCKLKICLGTSFYS